MTTTLPHPTMLADPLTADDLATFPDDGNRYEIIGGVLYVSPSPTYRHQRVSLKLASALDAYATRTDSGMVVAAPMDVHLSPHDVVQPDVLMVGKDRLGIVQERGIAGAPDLVVEILSPSTMTTDFIRKAGLYAQYGVREYWIVDPEGETVVVQTLEGDRYVYVNEFGKDDTLTSPLLPGLALDLSHVFLTEPAAEATAATNRG